MEDAFAGLVAVVQYRRKDQIEYDPWHNMAAFDSLGAAESYCATCTGDSRPWEYRVVDLDKPTEQ